MSPETSQQVGALIDRIQTRFHEGHRQALPELLAMAAKVEARGIDDSLVDALHVIGDALEQHMFKEEMRLFPMMEQGGNTLIGLLIEDLHREHVAHEKAMNDLRARLGTLPEVHGTDQALQQFMRGLNDLASELALHIRAEDEELFPLFAPPASPGSPYTSNPPSPATSIS
jgi:regulator of cell morphogenesis and NO signaling